MLHHFQLLSISWLQNWIICKVEPMETWDLVVGFGDLRHGCHMPCLKSWLGNVSPVSEICVATTSKAFNLEGNALNPIISNLSCRLWYPSSGNFDCRLLRSDLLWSFAAPSVAFLSRKHHGNSMNVCSKVMGLENVSPASNLASFWGYLYPIPSMYGIFTYICHKNQPNVGKYTIHGSYGYAKFWECKSVFLVLGCLQIRWKNDLEENISCWSLGFFKQTLEGLRVFWCAHFMLDFDSTRKR